RAKKGSQENENRQRSPVCCICCFDPDHGTSYLEEHLLPWLYTVLPGRFRLEMGPDTHVCAAVRRHIVYFCQDAEEFQVYGWAGSNVRFAQFSDSCSGFAGRSFDLDLYTGREP